MCSCREQLEKLLSETLKEPVVDIDMFKGITYSVVFHTETVRGKEKRKEKKLYHTHCPWCGEKYDV